MSLTGSCLAWSNELQTPPRLDNPDPDTDTRIERDIPSATALDILDGREKSLDAIRDNRELLKLLVTWGFNVVINIEGQVTPRRPIHLMRREDGSYGKNNTDSDGPYSEKGYEMGILSHPMLSYHASNYQINASHHEKQPLGVISGAIAMSHTDIRRLATEVIAVVETSIDAVKTARDPNIGGYNLTHIGSLDAIAGAYVPIPEFLSDETHYTHRE